MTRKYLSCLNTNGRWNRRYVWNGYTVYPCTLCIPPVGVDIFIDIEISTWVAFSIRRLHLTTSSFLNIGIDTNHRSSYNCGVTVVVGGGGDTCVLRISQCRKIRLVKQGNQLNNRANVSLTPRPTHR